MNKKTFTLLFTVVTTIVNIVITLVLIFLLLVFSIFLFYKVLRINPETNQSLYALTPMICFIAGVVIDMVFYSKSFTWVVRKLNLFPKLDERIMGRYYQVLKEDAQKFNTNQTEEKKEEKPKTILPKSVLDDEE